MEANFKNEFVSAMISHILGVKVSNDQKSPTENIVPSMKCMLTSLGLMSPCYVHQKFLDQLKYFLELTIHNML